MLQYKAKLLQSLHTAADDEPISIKIISPLTQQTVDVLVQPNNLIGSQQNFSSYLLNFVMQFGFIISALIVLAVTIWGECCDDNNALSAIGFVHRGVCI